MSTPPPHPTPASNKFHAIHAKLCETSQSALHPTHSSSTNPHAPSPYSIPPSHALQILPHTFLPAANWIPFFALSVSISLTLSLSIIPNFLALVLGNKFLRSLTAFRFSWDRFSRQFSKLLSPLSLAACLSHSIYFLLFSVCPYASSVSCKCCPSANKIYFLFAPLA